LDLEAWRYSNSVNQMFLTRNRWKIAEKVTAKMDQLGIEVFLAPGMSVPAVKHETFKDNYFQSIYTSMFNYLNFPAGVLPITKVREDE